MANISDVAKRANVSKATVSRYINDKHVSEHTAMKIKAAIEELSYVPNRFAQSISSQKSNLIGIIVPSLRNSFYMEMISHIEKMAAKEQVSCLIFSSHNDVNYENDALKVCEQFKVQGVVLATCDNDNDVSGYKVPIVAVDCFLESAKVNIIVNNPRIGQLIAQQFIEAASNKILYLEQNTCLDTLISRKESFKKAMDLEDATVTYVRLDSSSVEKTIEQLLQIEDIASYDGVFLGNERIALSYYNIVETPAFCVTVDGTHFSKFLFKSLVFVSQPIERMSEYAYRTLKNFEANQRTYRLEIEDIK